MAKRKYRQHSAAEEVAILKRALVDRQQLSKVCEEHDLQPSVFYVWQKQFFENGEAAFSKDQSAEQRELEKKVEHLEARLAKKNAVIAKVTGEYVKLKRKSLGSPEGPLGSS